MDTFRTIVRAIGVAGMLGILVVSLFDGGDSLPTGSAAPTTTGRTLDGAPFDLAGWQGQPVLVNLWATWCAPCVRELPELAAAARQHGDVRFVGLAVDSPDDDVVQMVARFAVPYPVVRIDGATQAAWKAQAVPVTYLVDAAGNVAWSALGGLSQHDIDAVLARFIPAQPR